MLQLARKGLQYFKSLTKKTCSGNGVMSEKVFAIGGGSRSKHKRKKKKKVFCYQNCSDLL